MRRFAQLLILALLVAAAVAPSAHAAAQDDRPVAPSASAWFPVDAPSKPMRPGTPVVPGSSAVCPTTVPSCTPVRVYNAATDAAAGVITATPILGGVITGGAVAGGAAADAAKDVVVDAASGAFQSSINSLTKMLGESAIENMAQINDGMLNSAEPKLTGAKGAWFTKQYGDITLIAAMIATLMVILGVASESLRGNPAGGLRILFIYLPAAAFATGVAPWLVDLLVRFADETSDWLYGRSADDIATFMTSLSALYEATEDGSVTAAQTATLGSTLLLSVCMVLLSICTYLLMVARAMAIYAAVLILPLALAAWIFPRARHMVQKVLELLLVFILVKPIMVIIFKAGTGIYISGLDQAPGTGSESLVQLSIGVIFMAASLAVPLGLLMVVPGFTQSIVTARAGAQATKRAASAAGTATGSMGGRLKDGAKRVGGSLGRGGGGFRTAPGGGGRGPAGGAGSPGAPGAGGTSPASVSAGKVASAAGGKSSMGTGGASPSTAAVGGAAAGMVGAAAVGASVAAPAARAAAGAAGAPGASGGAAAVAAAGPMAGAAARVAGGTVGSAATGSGQSSSPQRAPHDLTERGKGAQWPDNAENRPPSGQATPGSAAVKPPAKGGATSSQYNVNGGPKPPSVGSI